MVYEVVPFLVDLNERFLEVLTAPFKHTDMLWIAVPLVLTIFLTELYFSRYKAEQLGWNSAFGNALVLLFVAVDMFRFLYNHDMLSVMTLKLALAITVAIMAILISMLNFLHLIPESLAYGMSSKLPMNFVAYIGLILIYSNIPADFITLLASALLLVVFSALIITMRSLVPSSVEDVSY